MPIFDTGEWSVDVAQCLLQGAADRVPDGVQRRESWDSTTRASAELTVY